jgi:hypothetical protein
MQQLEPQSKVSWRYQANALTELGIVCSLSSGRIVANPDYTGFGVTSWWTVIHQRLRGAPDLPKVLAEELAIWQERTV